MRNLFLTVILLIWAGGTAPSAHADVFVNAEGGATIEISSAPLESENVVRLEEPVLEVAVEQHQAIAPTAQLPYHEEVLQAAQATTLDPALIHAVITVESKHNPNAVSPKGAHGLMQLMPLTAKRFNANVNNPQQNILAGAQYLRELSNLYHGNLNLMLAAYNAGPAAVEKYHGQIPPFIETQLYVPKVLKLYQHYSGKKS